MMTVEMQKQSEIKSLKLWAIGAPVLMESCGRNRWLRCYLTKWSKCEGEFFFWVGGRDKAAVIGQDLDLGLSNKRLFVKMISLAQRRNIR